MQFREYFLSQFDRHLSTGIIEFGKKLSNTQTDVFLVMARKAACFVECLEELSLTKLQGQVVTDRVLDMDSSWLKGKDVVIVDDAIVSGTTIYEVIKQLTSAGVARIRVVVICTNIDWFVPSLLDDDNGKSYLEEPYMQLKNEECIQVCASIVTALSIFPRPYSVDFPMYKNTRISETVFAQVLTHFLWESDDISTAIQSENDIVSLTLTPNETFIANLDTALGFSFSKLVICKIRLYGLLIENERVPYSKSRNRHNRSARRVYNLKVLPIVILKPIHTQDVNAIFETIAGSLAEDGELLIRNFTSTASRLRLIQHIVANYLGRLWIDSITHLTDSKISLVQDDRSINFLYPPHLLPVIHGILAQQEPMFKVVNYLENAAPFDPTPEYKSVIHGDNLISITAKLTEPFIHLYHDKELISRQLVKTHGKQVFDRPEYKSIVTRLKKGFPITFLDNLIENVAGKYDHKKLVSLFLDKSIDLGIVVPITGERNGVFFRAYRHGEDVVFGEAEEKLCAVMLKSFLEQSGREDLLHFWTEKLFVLFVKIGVQKKFLKEFIYDNPPKEVVRILSVKNYLFGQVAKEQILDPTQNVVEPVYLNEDQKSQWLTNILVEKRILTNITSKSGPRYRLNDTDASDYQTSSILEAENIGDIFGKLYANRRNKTKPSLEENDLVMLTSCLNPNDIAASMAAELFIFKNKWSNYRSGVIKDVVHEERLYEVASSIRHGNILWTAINSGQKKFRDYRDKSGHQLINDIGEQFQERIYQRGWLQFWSKNLDWDDSSIPTQLKELIANQAIWLFRTNIYMRCLELLLYAMMKLSGRTDKILQAKDAELQTLKDNLANIKRKVKALKAETPIDQNKIDVLNAQEDPHDKHIRRLSDEIAELNSTQTQIPSEIKELQAKIDVYSTTDEDINAFVTSVFTTCESKSLSVFQEQKLINQTIRRLDDCSLQTKLLLEQVDLIVTPFGKVEQSFDYSNVLYIQAICKDHKQKIHFETFISNELLEFEKEVFRFKARTGIPSFFLVPSHKNVAENSFIVLGRGMNSKQRLIHFAVKLFEKWKFDPALKMLFLPDLSTECAFNIQVKNNNNIKSGYFYDRLFKLIPQIDEAVSFTVGGLSSNISTEVVDDVIRDSDGYFEVAVNEKGQQETQANLKGLIISKAEKDMDIGIITIVPPELAAIKEILKNISQANGTKTHRKYFTGFLDGESKIQHRVVVTQQLIQGNESVISAYKDMVEEFNPKLMILFGIAGSISKDVKLCDVVIVNEVIAYDRRKETGKTFRRGSTYRASAIVAQFINSFFNEFGEKPRFTSAPGSTATEFMADAGPLGSGNAVIGDPFSEIKKWLLDFNSKTCAVETEAVGFANADWEEGLKKITNMVGALVIRGISDHADFDKDDKWRKIASQNAALVLVEFVKILPPIQQFL